MKRELRIGLIGYKFMGKAHSNAWHNVDRFFELPAQPVMQVVCGRNGRAVKAFAKQWGWRNVETDYKALVEREDVDVVVEPLLSDLLCNPARDHPQRAKVAERSPARPPG